MEDLLDFVSVGCYRDAKWLTSPIAPKRRPRWMSSCCWTALIYAAMDSYRSRHCVLSVEKSERGDVSIILSSTGASVRLMDSATCE